MGKEKIDGISYKKIFLSNSFNLDRRSDQFIAFINTETFNLDIIYYTIRELGKSFSGAAHFKDFKILNGINIPQETIVKWRPGGDSVVHRFKILKLKFINKQDVNQDMFFPDKNIKEDYYQFF